MQLSNLYRENAWEEEGAGEGWRNSVPGPGCLKAGAGTFRFHLFPLSFLGGGKADLFPCPSKFSCHVKPGEDLSH